MSLEDPFFVVKGEVQKAVNTARGLYQRWCQLLQETQLSNPHKFKIEPSEVADRRSFVTEMQKSVKEMQDHILSPEAQTYVERRNREVLLESRDRSGFLDVEDLSMTDSHTLEEQQLHQKLIMEEQDEQLELVSGSIRVLKHMSGQIGEELGEETVMLEDFACEMDGTHSRMDRVLRKMARVSHVASDSRQWCIMGLLAIIVVVVTVLLLVFAA
ncbi:Syntaxin-10 [Varanus komodoensis]|nr:Syntaxin-10 [Varanus komodoensis]